MTIRIPETPPLVLARAAGVLYLIIIGFGLFGELFVRSSLTIPGDAAATAANILGAEGLFRFGFLADSIMFLCDVALAVLLYVLLKPVHRTLALMALCFRLAQAAVIALNLLNYHAALLVLEGPAYDAAFGKDQVEALAALFLELHGHGYDLALILFGAHCLVLGFLIARSLYLPKLLGYLAMAAGVTYLVGSYTLFLFPHLSGTVLPIYGVALVSELSLCLWLLIKGVNLERWNAVTGSAGVE